MFSTTAECAALKIALGRGLAARFDAGPPVLAGEPVEDNSTLESSNYRLTRRSPRSQWVELFFFATSASFA